LRRESKSRTVPNHNPQRTEENAMKKMFHAPMLVEETTLAELTLLQVISEVEKG
jgi:hypothetical protein